MKTFILYVFAGCVLASCNHAYYSPNTPNAPLLTQKGEVRLNGLYSAGSLSNFTGGEAQIAVGVTDHFGILANGMWVSKSENVSAYGTRIEKGAGSYAEFAGGYFSALDTKKKSVAEVYGGVGFGSANNDYGNSLISKVNFTKLFIQPSIGYKSNLFEVALVPKFGLVSWKVPQDNLMRDNSGNHFDDQQDLNAIRNNKTFFAIEPALITRFGWKNVKFQASLCPAFVNKTEVRDVIESSVASIGLSINILPKKAIK